MKDCQRGLKYLRRMHKLTQYQLGEKLGVSNRVVCSWEKDQSFMTFDKACQLADYFGVSLDRIRTPVAYVDHGENQSYITNNLGSFALSDEEFALIQLYRKLSVEGQSLARIVVEDMVLSKRHDRPTAKES